jgi:hypothetical protein
MPRPARDIRARSPTHDFLQVGARKGTAGTPPEKSKRSDWPPVPDLFDVITYFRARGDSYQLIASIGFWVGENPSKALTAPRVPRREVQHQSAYVR